VQVVEIRPSDKPGSFTVFAMTGPGDMQVRCNGIATVTATVAWREHWQREHGVRDGDR